MKKVLFTLLTSGVMFLGAHSQYCGHFGNPSGPSQCTPSGTMTRPGLSPNSDSLPPVVNGVVSTTVIQFRNFDTARVAGNLVTVNYLIIDSIGNLPTGLCWATDRADNTYCNGVGNGSCPGGQPGEGCIKVNGTPCSDPGQYKLKIIVKVDVGLGFPITTDAEAANLKYIVRVINNGDAEVALDSTQTVPFTKPAGYSASAVCGNDITDMGSIQTSLNIVPNPFNNKAVVSFFSNNSGVMTERLTNSIGSEVYRKAMDVRTGENTSLIERGSLPTGVYFYSISDGKNLVTKRIVISE